MYQTTPRVGSGRIQVDDTGVRIFFCDDFNRFYRWLIAKYFWNTVRMQSPKFGSHITILNNKLHKFKKESVLKFNGTYVKFFYYPEEVIRSRLNFFIPVKSNVAEDIKKAAGVIDDKNFWGLHATVANFKFENNLTKP